MDILNKYNVNELKKIIKFYNLYNDIDIKKLKKNDIIDKILEKVIIDDNNNMIIKDILSNNDKYNIDDIIRENRNNKEIINDLTLEIENLKKIINEYELKKKEKYIRERNLLKSENKELLKRGRKIKNN